MAKPPADADPEKVHHRSCVLMATFEQHGRLMMGRLFRLEVEPMPVGSIVVYNLIFAAFFFGFYWACERLTDGEVGRWAIYAPLCIGLLTCTIFTVVTYVSFDRARRLGPWLIYDKASGRVSLPREGVTFEPSEIVHLQYITTKRLDLGGVTNNERMSELNLVTCRGGVRKRWPLLRSIANLRAFDRLLKPVVENTNMPVVARRG